MKPSNLSDAHIVACNSSRPNDRELASLLGSLLDSMPWVVHSLSASRNILVKPNLGGGNPASMTSKQAMIAFCSYLRDNYDAHVVLGDSSVIGSRSTTSIEALGLREALGPLGVAVVDLADCNTVRVPIPEGRTIGEVHVYEPVLQADFVVSLAKLKTNYATRTTLTIKNMKGVISGSDKIRFHRLGVADCLADLMEVVRPHLGVIDAIQGWDVVRSVDVGAMVAGGDPVAVDYLGTLLTGINPGEVKYLAVALERGIGRLPSALEQAKARRYSKPFEGPLDNPAGIQLPENIEVVAGGACSGCISILQAAVERMEAAELLEGLPPITLALGPQGRPVRTDGRLIVAMGNCSGARKDADRVMVGCPPQSRFEVQRVLEELRVLPLK